MRILFTIQYRPGKLEDRSLSEGPAAADNDVTGILHGGDSPGSQEDLLPGLPQVDDVDPVHLLLEDVLLHRLLAVARPNVGGSCQHLGDIILLQTQMGNYCGRTASVIVTYLLY